MDVRLSGVLVRICFVRDFRRGKSGRRKSNSGREEFTEPAALTIKCSLARVDHQEY